MYLAQTNLEVDTTKVYVYLGTEVYLTKPGFFDPAIHTRKPSKQLLAKDLFDKYGRDTEIYELTAKRKALLKDN